MLFQKAQKVVKTLTSENVAAAFRLLQRYADETDTRNVILLRRCADRSRRLHETFQRRLESLESAPGL